MISTEYNDTGWTIHNDIQSVTVGINYRIGFCRDQNQTPMLIRLGVKHTALFLREAGLQFIPNKKPAKLFHSGLVWDNEVGRHGRLCYKACGMLVPFKFNDRRIYGIAVEGEMKPSKVDSAKPTKK